MQIIIQQRQSIFDVAIEYLGSAEGVFDLLRLNNLSSFSIPPGTVLEVPNVPLNKTVRQIMLTERIHLATANKVEPTGSFSNSFSSSFNN